MLDILLFKPKVFHFSLGRRLCSKTVDMELASGVARTTLENGRQRNHHLVVVEALVSVGLQKEEVPHKALKFLVFVCFLLCG